MKIGVLGAGRMAGALVPHWLKAGHEVLIGGRTVPKAKALAARLGARGGSLREAAEFGEVVMLAVLSPGVDSTLEAAGAADRTLAGKILIDCNNPVGEGFMLTTEPGTSLSERIAERSGADVAKAFNQVHADVWEGTVHFDGAPVVVPVAGGAEAKEVAAALVRDAGGEPLDAGELEQARHLEAMAAIIIRLLFGGADTLSAFQLTVGARSRTRGAARGL